MPDNLSLPQHNPDVFEFLKTRRSNLAKLVGEPGPTDAQLEDMLTIAARVPDHRKLAPWRFIIFSGKARSDIGQHLGAVFKRENPDMPLDRVMFEANRFMRAPVIVGIVSSTVDCPRGTPKWEQELSAGAVCFNLCLAAQASGFGAQWLTEWYAYDPDIQSAMGLSEHEKIAGFVYIGTPSEAPTERARPELKSLISHWKIADATN